LPPLLAVVAQLDDTFKVPAQSRRTGRAASMMRRQNSPLSQQEKIAAVGFVNQHSDREA